MIFCDYRKENIEWTKLPWQKYDCHNSALLQFITVKSNT